jgi:hypothetical protein
MHIIEFAFGFGRGPDKGQRKQRMKKAFRSLGKRVVRAETSMIKRAATGLNGFQKAKVDGDGLRTGTRAALASEKAAKKLGANRKNQRRAKIVGANVGVRAGVYGSLAKQQAGRVRR